MKLYVGGRRKGGKKVWHAPSSAFIKFPRGPTDVRSKTGMGRWTHLSACGPKRTFHYVALMSLSGVKRTSLVAPHMSAFDPKRTWRQSCGSLNEPNLNR